MSEKIGLGFVAKMANKKAVQRRKDGEVPKHMSLDGQLALMHDKITRYFKTRTLDEILALAADAHFALQAAIIELAPQEEEDWNEEDDLEETLPRPKTPRVDAPLDADDISSLLPDELKDWQTNPKVARDLRDYLEAVNQWNRLDEKIKDIIEKAEKVLEVEEITRKDKENNNE